MGSPYQSDSMRHTRDVYEGICGRMIRFSYYCKYGVLVLVMTALLMSSKDETRLGMASSNYGREVFTICNTITL